MNTTRSRLVLGLVAALVAFIFAGCRSISVSPEPAEAVDMGVVRFESDPDGVLPGRFWDAYLLFEEAGREYDRREFRQALELYARIPAEFPESDLVGRALFNEAVCLEELGHFEESNAIYRRLLVQYPQAIDTDRVWFRIAECAEQAGDWETAARIFGQALPGLGLTPIREAEARVRLGIALYHLERTQAAIGALRRGLEQLRDLRNHSIRFADYYVGKGYFTLGEIYFQRFRSLSLDVPEPEIPRTLDHKSELLLLARAQYVQAIRSYAVEWMTAALCRIGEAYEHYRRAVLMAPLPTGLTAQEEREYIIRLEEAMEPVLRKSIEAHRRNLRLAGELGIENEWTRTSRLKVEQQASE